MSSESDALSDMSRSQLEERVANLEDEINQHELVDPLEMAALRRLLNGLAGYTDADPEDVPSVMEVAIEAGERMNELSRRVDSVETSQERLSEIAREEESLSSDPNVENWRAIVTTAQNLSSHPEHVTQGNFVKLYKKQIATAIGCSERHAQNLIEQYGADPEDHKKGKKGTDWQEHKRRKTSRKTEGAGIQKKALLIDQDVWGKDV